ncbi:GAP1-N1 domain-containing protein [Pseudomonas sp. R76]|uniref:GAP1-N1 domain-containing protein n=1 Tax=Pseudomonas sp. R76 TaxID=1573711 RepID=UPI001357D7DF|nr:hypothetical protein [Pseudomonas sp. R76]
MKFDQCLFGYDDGHRLLASSVPLGTETSLLTELSDLAPGTIFSQSEGYWTGLPVPAIGRYVLMRTWPAPEMPRPGCVWTHALLIPLTFFESFEDLSALQAFARRPNGLVDKEHYRQALNVGGQEVVNAPKFLDDKVINQLLLSLYSSVAEPIEVERPGQIDLPLFAVWSQQWPRLRRNLRFQTAVSRGGRFIGSIKFDVTAELAHILSEQPSTKSESEPWLITAAADIKEGALGALRSFLWRYGSDVKRQRGSFLPLTQIKMIEMGGGPDAATQLVDIVTGAFASPEDAKKLKQDLVDGALAPFAQPRLLECLLSNSSACSSFPAPEPLGISRLQSLWPDRREEMASLLETAVKATGPLADAIVECLIGGSTDSLTWLATNGSLPTRIRLVQASPDILLGDWVIDLNSSILADLLSLVGDRLQGLETLVPRLLVRNDPLLAKLVFDHWPIITASQVLRSISRDVGQATDTWWHALRSHAALLLHPEVMSCVSQTSQLYAVGELLDWQVSRDTVNAVELLSLAFNRAVDDLSSKRSDILHCFLIKIALIAGGNGGNALVEKLYNLVHDQLLASQLADPAKEILREVLADAGWLKGWDVALRFRLAIAGAYIRFYWPPLSYANLSVTRKGMKMLADAASDIPEGDIYAHAADRLT